MRRRGGSHIACSEAAIVLRMWRRYQIDAQSRTWMELWDQVKVRAQECVGTNWDQSLLSTGAASVCLQLA